MRPLACGRPCRPAPVRDATFPDPLGRSEAEVALVRLEYHLKELRRPQEEAARLRKEERARNAPAAKLDRQKRRNKTAREKYREKKEVRLKAAHELGRHRLQERRRAVPIDRNEAWLKIKTVQQGKFPVIGFVKDPTGVAALYLGKREGNDLVYMGKVGTGWSRTVSSQIRKQLDTVVSPKSKLTKPIRKPKATWVEPSFTAEVEFRDITSEGLLRQSSFKGLSKGTPRN